MNETIHSNIETYKKLLKSYIETQDEKSLYRAEKVSKALIQNNILPDEIVNIHNQALSELFPDLPKQMKDSMTFLLEIMISYGVALQETEALREQQFALKSEIAVAADMQKSLLRTEKYEMEGLDLGVISVPANQMNGDYHHFVKGDDGSLGIAIADVIGKGIPAALCMSMIKYSLDSYPMNAMTPSQILQNLNRVVEKNIDSSMFITMVYAQYIPHESKLLFSTAGHEPGFYYNAEKDVFEELTTGDLVLGVLPDSKYKQRERTIKQDDMVILLTDGVTECRDGDRFIEIEEVLEVIRKYAHLPAQEMVNQVYKHFERLQDFHLRDDFTLFVLRKKV